MIKENIKTYCKSKINELQKCSQGDKRMPKGRSAKSVSLLVVLIRPDIEKDFYF
jgi:hypothetical protein